MSYLSRIGLLGFLAFGTSAPSLAAPTPYVPDANTVYLFHLDEAPGASVATNSAALTAPPNAIAFDGNNFAGDGINQAAVTSLFGTASYAGFGTCANLSVNDLGLGLDANGDGGFMLDDGAPFSADRLPTHSFFGAGNEFTLEALVNLPSITSGNREIIATDHGGPNNADRGLQFRVTGAGQLELNFIGVNATSLLVPIPTTGDHAFAANEWFHVALVYDGANARFYWTRLSVTATNANLIGGPLAEGVELADDALLVIGNEARVVGTTGSTEGLVGLIDEVRISNIARAATNFYWSATPPADGDADGLADSWETNYFGNLTQGGTNDFDLDTYNNLAEFTAGSNPTNLLSTPLNKDADGLPDTWEQTYFSSLTQGDAGDFDGDGFTNLQEYLAGTHPANAAFTPADIDGDSLPDAWEQQHFNNSLAQLAGGDFDADGYSNLSEYQNGTNPASSASFPALPSVNYVPIEDGNTNTSEYGYAGSSSINTVNFVHNALHTENGQQFIAYYYRHATSTTDPNNNRIVIARRHINTNVWQMFFTTFTANAITDGHDVAAFGIDGAGYLHLSWGMHGDAFHYAKTTTPVFGTNAIIFGPDTTMTGRENSVTYPQWLRLPNGDLLYFFREGASGNGDTFLNRYYVASQTWSNVHITASTQLPFLKGTGWNPNYNAYPNMPQLDAEGNFHIVWTWRYQSDSPAGESGYQTNHDFDYARSTNGGLTWLRQNGVPYALPISQSGENGNPNTTAEKILNIPEGYSLINQAGMCLDTNNWPVIATWWAPGTGLAHTNTWWTPDMGTNSFRRQYMVSFRDANGVWQVRRISNRTNDPVGTKYNESFVRNLGRPVVVCDPVGRLIVLYRDNFGSNGLTIAHSLPYAVDPQRTNWTTIDLTTANLGNYEPVIDEARWELDQNLHIVYQPSQGEGYTPPANTAAQIGIVEWNAAAYFAHRPALSLSFANSTNAALTFNSQLGWGYRVQTSTNLTTWETLVTLPGVSGQLQYTHTNSIGTTQRYWRLQSQEGGFAP
jgi:hypothetical protein